jgi:Arc/MetJ family transcription regulator
MATNLEIDNELIQEALQLGGHRTKRAVVEEALQEYVQRRKQLKITELFGTIEYEDDYDYKQQREGLSPASNVGAPRQHL